MKRNRKKPKLVEAGDPEVEADDTEDENDEAIEGEAVEVDDQEAEIETDDASDNEAEDDADQEPELYTVKVDGEEIEVDLDTLKSGFMMQSAFTKRTQALAEERKVLEGELQNAREARDTYLQNAQQIAQILQAQTHKNRIGPDCGKNLIQRTMPMRFICTNSAKSSWRIQMLTLNA